MLKKLGIVKTKNKGYKVFMEHIAPDFLDNTMIPSEYVKFCWKKYETSGVSRTNSLNGTIFELIIATLFVKEGLVPLHLQEGYSKGLYKDVCKEYIAELNKELVQVKNSIKKELQ